MRDCVLSVANVLERSLHVLRILGLSPLCLVEREEFLSLRGRALLGLGRRAAVNNVGLKLEPTELAFKEKRDMREALLGVGEVMHRTIAEKGHECKADENKERVAHMEALSPRIEAVARDILPLRETILL